MNKNISKENIDEADRNPNAVEKAFSDLMKYIVSKDLQNKETNVVSKDLCSKKNNDELKNTNSPRP